MTTPEQWLTAINLGAALINTTSLLRLLWERYKR